MGTLLNEGVNIPNNVAIGGALVNYTENYEFANTGLRSEMLDLRIAITEDLEKAIEALEKAAKMTDKHITKLNNDNTMQKFANGTHTLKGWLKTFWPVDPDRGCI